MVKVPPSVSDVTQRPSSGRGEDRNWGETLTSLDAT